MKEEILSLVQNAKNVINELENYLFANHREFYIFSKAKIESAKESLEFIENEINNFDDQALQAAKTDLSTVIEKFSIESFGAKGDSLDYKFPVEDKQSEFSKDELDNLLGALDNANFDEIITNTTEGINTLSVDQEATTVEPDALLENATLVQETAPEVFVEAIPNNEAFGTLPEFPEINGTAEANFNQPMDTTLVQNVDMQPQVIDSFGAQPQTEVIEQPPMVEQAPIVNEIPTAFQTFETETVAA